MTLSLLPFLMGKRIQNHFGRASVFLICAFVSFSTAYSQSSILLTQGNRSLPDPLSSYDFLKNPGLAAKAKAANAISETAGCQTLEVWEPVFASEDLWRSITKVGVVAVADKLNCVKVGSPARFAQIDRETGIATSLGWFFPTAISKRRAEYHDQEESILLAAGLAGSAESVVMVSGRVIASLPMKKAPYVPRMLGARMITRDQMESAIFDKAQIIDVRSEAQFAISHLRGSTNVPYTLGARSQALDASKNYAKNGDAFNVRLINSNRETPVILIGENPMSDGVYRAAVILRNEGWKKIFVFYEGFGYFAGNAWSPPASSKIIKVLTNAKELAALENTSVSPQFVDVRSRAEFEKGTIKGAILGTYVEKDDSLLRTPGLSGSQLLKHGDRWAAPSTLDKTRPLVLVGEELRDWRGYKAALVAKSQGFASVYWYRPGTNAN